MENLKILIVEDDSIIAMFTRIILEKRGYNVVRTLSTGEEALVYVQKERPDLILMDIWLAGKLDGIETTEMIQNDHSIPVIYITANTDTQTINRIKETHTTALLSKPFVPSDLYDRIDNLIVPH